jgi:hypothetical protein
VGVGVGLSGGGDCGVSVIARTDVLPGSDPGSPEAVFAGLEDRFPVALREAGRVLAATGAGAVLVEVGDGREVAMTGRAMGLTEPSPLASAAALGRHGVAPSVGVDVQVLDLASGATAAPASAIRLAAMSTPAAAASTVGVGGCGGGGGAR